MLELSRDLDVNVHREIYRASYYEFFKDAYKALLTDEPYNDNWHIRILCDVLQGECIRIAKGQPKGKDLIINMPFRSAKSLITSVIFPVWAWTIKPSLKFICISYSDDLSLELSQLSRSLIYTDWFQNIYGSMFNPNGDENTKSFYKNSFGGFRKSVGTGGQITGSGGDFLILDDAQNPKKAASEKERYNTIAFYDQTLYSRLNQPEIGVRINIQQRLHEQDLTGHILSKDIENYELIKIPAELKPEDQPSPLRLKHFYKDNLFWPERFSRKQLKSYYNVLGSYGAAGQLQQRPAPQEGGLIKREWFTILNPSELQRDISQHPIHFFLDTSDPDPTKDRDSSDFTAIVTCYKKDNHVFIVDVVKKQLPFFEICKFIPQYVTTHYYTNDSKIKIEPKSSGRSVVSQLKATTMLNIVELKSPKDDKVTRLSAIQPLLEAGRVRLLEGNYVNTFLDELCMFPNVKNDDQVDAFVYAVCDLLMEGDFDFAFI